MKKPHIAFIVESAHGHINPTLETAAELIKRGYYVTHAVKSYFAPRVSASGSEAIIYRPLENKLKIFQEIRKSGKGPGFEFDFMAVDSKRFAELHDEECENSVEQLECCYSGRRPNLIIYDRSNLAGRSLAKAWSISTIEYSPGLVAGCGEDYDPNLVIVSLPRFFQENADLLDRRFKFVGPIFNSGKFFKPWKRRDSSKKVILVSATTGLLPQVDYFKAAIDAFREFPQQVVLSIGEEIELAALGPLPPNFEVNQLSSQREILKHACLFVGQGGPSSSLEAIFCGVPLLLLPPSQIHNGYARRLADIGLAISLTNDEANVASIKQSATRILGDTAMSARVRQAQQEIKESGGAIFAADLIERCVPQTV